jgi:putative heme iron utilization protein
LTSRDEYEGMVDTLDDLTEGTTAWKEAVSELNAKVLELIAAYPQLIQFLQIAENGVMTIDSAGWDKVIKEQEGRVAISQQMVAKR